MIRIGLISDTHGYFDPQLTELLTPCDEIWHAGDIGNVSVYQDLQKLNKPVISVYGNIDGNDVRQLSEETRIWQVENKRVCMTHIGGYPGKYPARVKQLLSDHKPDIFICGHSHILRVIYDKAYKLLYLNPGACGLEGFHKVRTALRFTIDPDAVKDMEVIELANRR